MDSFFNFMEMMEDGLWTYMGVPLIIFLGIYLSFKSRFFQIRHFPLIFKTFFGFFSAKHAETNSTIGVHPLKTFFAAVGGCVGIGNIVGICTAVQLGGPGALFWIWLTALAGMIIKYSEIYLGLRYRVADGKGGYNGGPMYFLPKAFKSKAFPIIIALLLCVYGVEVYQFSVISKSISMNFGIHSLLVIVVLLILVIFAGSGGVRRVGNISSKVLPFFVVLYVSMGLWVLFNHLSAVPGVIHLIFTSAFTGHAAVGGFLGASMMAALSYGMRRGCYTGDIGVGYASVIHSESSVQVPEKQASLAIVDIFLDTFIVCTTSLMLILTTDVWHQPIEAGMLVQMALSQHFPYMDLFIPIFLFMLGYNTINAYFCVGLKCAAYLSPTKGRKIYYGYAIIALLFFSFTGTAEAQAIMAIAGVSLLIINGIAIFRLREEISFDLVEEKTSSTTVKESTAILERT